MKKELTETNLQYFSRLDNEAYEMFNIQAGLFNHNDFEDDDQISEHSEIIDFSLENSQKKQTSKREVWRKEDMILFFKFLGLYHLLFPHEFLIWKANKKNIFTAMEKVIKMKDRYQCKSKFRTFRRKHQKPKNRNEHEPCMKSLIIKNLSVYSDFDEECNQIIELMIDENKDSLNLNLSGNLEMMRKTIMVELSYESSEIHDEIIHSSSNSSLNSSIFQDETRAEILNEYTKYFSEYENLRIESDSFFRSEL